MNETGPSLEPWGMLPQRVFHDETRLPTLTRWRRSLSSSPSSPHLAHITSSQSQLLLSPSITPSAFYSRRITRLFHKSFPSGLPSWILDWTKWALTFVCFSFFFLYFFGLILVHKITIAFDVTDLGTIHLVHPCMVHPGSQVICVHLISTSSRCNLAITNRLRIPSACHIAAWPRRGYG